MGTFQGMETFEKITEKVKEKRMDTKVLDSICYVEKMMFFKRKVRILFFQDSIEVAFSKYVFRTTELDDNIPYIVNCSGKYEDIITYQVVLANSIGFYGNFVKTKKGKQKIIDSVSVHSQYEQSKLILEKIRTVTPLLTLKEKKKICPEEQFGKIVIVMDSGLLVSEFYIEVDKEDEGVSRNHRFTLKEPYGKHLVQVSWKQRDLNGDDPSIVSSNEIKVELSEETPEVYLRLKRGPKLEYAKKEMPN